MYCAVEEAFNNPTKGYNKEKDKLFKQVTDNQIQFNPESEHIKINNPKEPSIIPSNESTQSFFTAQGDLNDGIYGTSISELRDNNNDNDIFSLGSIVSNNSNESKKINHEQCITRFVNQIINDNESLVSSRDSQLYDHIKSCKYCKSQINNRLKKHSLVQKSDNIIEKEINNINEKQIISNNFFGYSLKEILLIVLAGIIIICVLDLIVKMSRKI